MAWLLAVVASFILFGATGAVADAPPAGIYIALIGSAAPPTDDELRQPFVRGVVFVRNWDLVEPARDVYTWMDFDHVVAAAERWGKSVLLGVKHGVKGAGLPDWYGGQRFSCASGTVLPVWYDPEFRAEFTGVTARLVNRYKEHPAVAGFVLSGFYAQQFAEMGNCPDFQVSDTQAWFGEPYAYKRQRSQEVALTLMDQISKRSFKPVRLAYNIMLNEQTGRRDASSADDYILQPLISQYGPARVVVGRTNLKPTTGDPLGVWNATPVAQDHQYLLAYAPYVFWQVDTVENGGPSTPDEWVQAGDIGLHYGMRWLEVRRGNVTDPELAAVLTCLNDAMVVGSGHCGH
jgi:Beta-galactosidase